MLQLNSNINKNLMRTFKTKIIINRSTKTIVNGRQEEAFEEYFNCWCNPKELYDKELYEAINMKVTNGLVFEVRYCEKIRVMREEIVKKKARFTIDFDNCIYDIYYMDFMNNSRDIVLIKANGVN